MSRNMYTIINIIKSQKQGSDRCKITIKFTGGGGGGGISVIFVQALT